MTITFTSIQAAVQNISLFADLDIDHFVTDSHFRIRQGLATEQQELEFLNGLYQSATVEC